MPNGMQTKISLSVTDDT